MKSTQARQRPGEPDFAVPQGGATEFPALPLSPVGDESGRGRAAWRAFRRATVAVRQHGVRVLPKDLPASAVGNTVAQLAAAVDTVLRGQPLCLPSFAASEHAPALIEALRSVTLSELSRAREMMRPRDIVELLEAIETVRNAVIGPREEEVGDSGRALEVEVAHDMRSPLTSILFLVETLRHGRSGPITPVQERQLGLVYSAAFALSALANDLIELAPRGGRLLDGEDVPFSVSDVLCGVRDMLLPIAEERGLALRFTPPDSDWRFGSPAALQRVLVNLTTNALKFTVTGSVDVAARQVSRTMVEFSVTDTGKGLPRHVVASLREGATAGRDAETGKFTSAGLGLALCKKLVRAMGGELVAESSAETGTRMRFTLDLQIAPRF